MKHDAGAPPTEAPDAKPPGHAPAAAPTSRSASDRIAGLDIARGLAIIGMFAAHLLTRRDLGWDPESWRFIAFGRPAILFVVLAGISIALISGRQTVLDGIPLVQARMRILVRGVLVFAIGGFLLMLDTGIANILEYYGLLFALALPFLQWKPKRLFIAAAILTIVTPIAHLFLENLSENTDRIRWSPTIVRLAVTGYYPAMILIIFILVGMGLGRLDLAQRRLQWRLVAIGAAMAAVGYTAGYVASHTLAPDPEPAVARPAPDCERGSDGILRCSDPEPEPEPVVALTDFSGLWTFEQHSGSPFEVTGSTGVAIAVIGLCLLLPRMAQFALSSVAATGALALSAYSGQLIMFHILRRGELRKYEVESFLWFTIGTLAICWAWKIVLGQGPLERLLTVVSSRAAGLPVRPSPVPLVTWIRGRTQGR